MRSAVTEAALDRIRINYDPSIITEGKRNGGVRIMEEGLGFLDSQ